jgi:hypothetical protein
MFPKSIENRNGNDIAFGLRSISIRNILFNSLMRTQRIVIPDILLHDAIKLTVTEYHEPVQRIAPNGADESLGIGIHIRCERGSRHGGDAKTFVVLFHELARPVIDEMG